MSIESTKRICNILPSRDTHNDWTFKDSLASGAMTAPAALPPRVDLRQAWWSVADQENTGSCVGWATADGVMRYSLVTAGRLAADERLSARFVWMASKETDEIADRPETFIEEAGTTLKAAMDVVRKFGVVTDAMLPFGIATTMYTGIEKQFYAAASTRRCANYFNLFKNTGQWKMWLAGNGPILVALSVDATWDNAAQTGGDLLAYQPGTERGGHAVCVVGYTENRFILRSSWGPSWGDGGYGYASEDYIRDAFFNESYGITL